MQVRLPVVAQGSQAGHNFKRNMALLPLVRNRFFPVMLPLVPGLPFAFPLWPLKTFDPCSDLVFPHHLHRHRVKEWRVLQDGLGHVPRLAAQFGHGDRFP